ncbi:G-protein coupled receptor dmsr-1-like [Mya arenaria]|uniref:G-protein coupled receptor dmsr-1-like n=1 Tax=Mya arenaria TaxID=6604 RepID=UPI0022E810F9|nr:G-protein coupled receptor dmsr-1-like [Mya arenaria]XP_052779503.1 G-protein coupled receptor dmsr-1-like [Mya arenaria]XP_052779504.1 G-protein coupled receptor dmsr-1-like [Mya arenaria]XP_052779505.1 G-protein coupled receptor dmsr-1-like [Mya arenaria]
MTTMVLPTENTSLISLLNATLMEDNPMMASDTAMHTFYKNYGRVHGYVSNVVCIFGVVSNILNVIVLTRRHMITPTNCILTALAIADFLTMLTYLVYATYFYIAKEPKWEVDHSQGWMYFILVHNHFIITCHNMAMWFTVSLAVFRYIFVCHHVIGNRLCSLNRAILTISIIVIATTFVCIPNYFLYKVVTLKEMGVNLSGYWIVDSDIVKEHNFFKVSIFWFFGVIMKVAPCILLTLLSSMIILTMHQASKRRVRLLQQTRSSDHDVNHEHNRTTWMLVSVVLFFVITEMPQGILAMVSGLNDHFFYEYYSNLGDVMDLLVLLNSAVNFVLYCIMSQQFRDTFKNLFVVNWPCRSKNYGKVNGHQNGVTHYKTVTTEVTML